MHGSFDRSQHHRHTDRNWNIVVCALPALVAVALVGLAIIQPAAPNWISEAAQAEFVGTNAPDLVTTQPAGPVMQVRTVKAD
jgi:hypothetical protein